MCGRKKKKRSWRRFAKQQERAFREKAEHLAKINAEIDRLERQYGMDLPLDHRVVGNSDSET